MTKTKWRQNVPSDWSGSKPAQFRVPDMSYSTMMQVPCSEDPKLFKMLAKAEPRLAKLTRYQVKYVERSGKPLKKFFVKDFSSGKCHRLNCNVCSNSKPGVPTRCQVKGVVYESTCLLCENEYKIKKSINGEKSLDHKGRYVGETSRTLAERSYEHAKGFRRKDISNFMFKHQLRISN